MAVDASKSLISIGIAFFAALGAFMLTYRSTHGSIAYSSSIVLLAVSAVLTIASMWCGFAAIGRAYRRGQRPADAAGLPWATRAISHLLGLQSLMGLGALFAFACAVWFWDAGSNSAADAQIRTLHARIDVLNARLDQQAGNIATFGQTQGAASQAYGAVAAIPQQLRAIGGTLDDIKTDLLQHLSGGGTPLLQPATQAQGPRAPPFQEADLTAVDWIQIQRSLLQLGFDVGPVDGQPGNKTRRAIRAYQVRLHAPADGRLTSRQIETLLGK